jgi:hypothetical protein
MRQQCTSRGVAPDVIILQTVLFVTMGQIVVSNFGNCAKNGFRYGLDDGHQRRMSCPPSSILSSCTLRILAWLIPEGTAS